MRSTLIEREANRRALAAGCMIRFFDLPTHRVEISCRFTARLLLTWFPYDRWVSADAVGRSDLLGAVAIAGRLLHRRPTLAAK
jgi:hypothetical protein